MIAGCFDLLLYCDNVLPGRFAQHRHAQPWQYTGETRAECLAQARRDGWIVNYKSGRAICPACSGKKRHACAEAVGDSSIINVRS